MSDLTAIVGLMKQNTNELGFIPIEGITRYLNTGRFIRTRYGYLLHSVAKAGETLTIAQACIDYDFRTRGHGQDIVRQLLARAESVNCKAITLRCAETLDANMFWQSQGFVHTSTLTPQNARKRRLLVYTFDLWKRLL